MDWLFRDLIFSFRTLWKDRASLALALLALALGIGSTTAMFSVIDNVLLNPWPYADGNHLAYVQIRDTDSNQKYGRAMFTPAELAAQATGQQAFRDLLSVDQEQVVWMRGTTPVSIKQTLVSGNTFESLAVKPLRGACFCRPMRKRAHLPFLS